VRAPRGAVAAVLLPIAIGLSGCSSQHDAVPDPHLPYATDWEQLREPFPDGAIDTTGALYLAEGAPMPDPTAPGTGKPIIYSLTSRRIKITYHPPTGGGCFIDVVRDFRTPEEEKLIRTAEVTYPLREAISPPDWAMLSRIPARKHLWWLGPDEGLRLPYAVTMDALRYYLDRTQRYGRGTPPYERPGAMQVSNVTYSASVTYRSSFAKGKATYRDVNVVELRLGWEAGSRNSKGFASAAGFNLDRTVLLDRNANVVAVFGDRIPRMGVT
jgi:hypothetical protein